MFLSVTLSCLPVLITHLLSQTRKRPDVGCTNFKHMAKEKSTPTVEEDFRDDVEMKEAHERQ
ncbi:unnamed protein product, partial [Protopolystoma xenopodis]